MKRAMPWSDDEEDDTSSNDSSTLDTDTSDYLGPTKNKFSQAESAMRKSKGVDFEALSRHGYNGRLSVLKVPPPKEPDQEQNWSWSSGKETREKEKEETYEDCRATGSRTNSEREEKRLLRDNGVYSGFDS